MMTEGAQKLATGAITSPSAAADWAMAGEGGFEVDFSDG
ncbi:hypothetical protein SUDANB180_02624 [Streptomyces sp. enrichment culture]